MKKSKRLKKLKAILRQSEPDKRKKGDPIFGPTPYGSVGGKPNICGYRPPRRKWDKQGDDEGIEV